MGPEDEKLTHHGVFVDIDDALEFLALVPSHRTVSRADYERALEKVRDVYLEKTARIRTLQSQESVTFF